jgi:5-methylcytosine-specific restriction endonuclease McrA
MKFELVEYHRNINDDELIADLKRIALELKKTAISRADNDESGKYGTTTYIRRFGSWFNALEKAGLEKTRTPMNLSEEELFKNLEDIWVKLGRQPRYAETQKPLSKYHVGTYENRFGTWRRALEKFVAYINNEENKLSEEAIRNIKIEPSTRHKTKRNINWRLRFIVMRRDNFKCKKCGRSPATDPSIILHVDHKNAWANGGETVFENLDTLCSKCNIGKSDLE